MSSEKKEYKKGELLMSKFKNEFKSFMEDVEKNKEYLENNIYKEFKQYK